MAASGYAAYDAATSRFRLTPEQALALTSEENPVFVPGGVRLAAATIAGVDLIVRRSERAMVSDGASTTRTWWRADCLSSHRTVWPPTSSTPWRRVHQGG